MHSTNRGYERKRSAPLTRLQNRGVGLSLSPNSVSSKTAPYYYVPYVRRVLGFPLDGDLHMMSKDEIDESILFYLDYLVGPRRWARTRATSWCMARPRLARPVRSRLRCGPQPLEVWAAPGEGACDNFGCSQFRIG